jgi:hypothetical protein
MQIHAEEPTSSRSQASTTDDWTGAVRRVRSEYTEMPGMRLTQEQAGRLFGLEPFACSLVLGWLMDEQFLRLSNGLYVKN